jgi:hypothetical protein
MSYRWFIGDVIITLIPGYFLLLGFEETLDQINQMLWAWYQVEWWRDCAPGFEEIHPKASSGKLPFYITVILKFSK